MNCGSDAVAAKMKNVTYKLLLLTVLSGIPSSVEGQGRGEFTCVECHGIVGEVTNCGEAIDDISVLTLVNCTGFCMTKVRYYIDQKIGVERNCSEECSEGCTMHLGTSTCIQCCHGDVCNSSTRIDDGARTTILALIVSNTCLLLMASRLCS